MKVKGHGKRAASASLAGAALTAFALPSAAGAAGAGRADQTDTAPIIWTGQASDKSSATIITGRVDPVDPSADPSASEPFVNLSEATAGKAGTYVLRATPGDWYRRLADQDGWVRLTLIAGEPAQVGLGLLHVRWVADGPGGIGHWVTQDGTAGKDAPNSVTNSAYTPSTDPLTDTRAETIRMTPIPENAQGGRRRVTFTRVRHCRRDIRATDHKPT